jgi:hypothetical protein
VNPSSSCSRKKRRAHSKEITSLVQEWLKDHVEDPYPTTEEKERFSRLWNMTLTQVSNLFNNVRRRSKWNTSSFMAHLVPTGDPYLTSCFLESATLFKDQNPIERYLSSSPEEDPQPSDLVARAADKIHFKSLIGQRKWNPTPSLASQRCPITEDDGQVETSSVSDKSSTNGSSCRSDLTDSSYRSGKKGKRRIITVRPEASNNGPYYCTYCWKSFSLSASWRKHEETLHKPQKQFECRMAELKPSLQDCGACLPITPGCHSSLDHNYKGCVNRSKEARTFNRKDHFLKHLSGIHNAYFNPIMESWVVSSSEDPSYYCGYCCKWFPTWTARLDHIGNHYRQYDYFDRSKWKLNDREIARDLKYINDHFRYRYRFDEFQEPSNKTIVHFSNIFNQTEKDCNEEDPALMALRLHWQQQASKEELDILFKLRSNHNKARIH